MSNSNTSNEPIYPSCPNGYLIPCRCPACVIETDRLDGAEAAARAEEARLRTYLKDCCCPCCEARARLRAISYDRAERSPAEIHCETSDRRDDNADSAIDARLAAIDQACLDETDRRLALLRDSDEERQAVRAAAEVSDKNSDAR